MSVKGKEKASEPAIVILEDEDEAANFFMKKKRRRPVIRDDSPILLSSPEKVRSEDESEDGDGQKRRRPAKPKKKDNIIPEWAKEPVRAPSSKRSRSATADKKGKGKEVATIVIDSSPEPEAAPQKKESALTPPPELSEEEKAKLAQAVRSAYDRPVEIDADEANDEGTSSAKVSAAAFGDAIRLNFRMVAPPERKADASAKAIEFYEKKRLITAGRTQPLSYAIGAFASQIRKPPDEIVFTNGGVRIFSKFLTPQALGLDYEADFVCYETAHWERLEAERAVLDDDEEENANDAQAEYEANARQSSEPAPETEHKVKFTLAGANGEVQAVVQPHVTAKALCKYYAKKSGMGEGEAPHLRLSLDGEMIEPETKFEDMDIDDGDQVDVIKV